MQAHLTLHMSKCHIVGNHMSRLIYTKYNITGRLVPKSRFLASLDKNDFTHMQLRECSGSGIECLSRDRRV